MKKLLPLVVLISTVGFAQYSDVLQLKNGSEIRGKIIFQDESGVKIEMKGGSVFFYEAKEIAGKGKFQPKVSGKGIFLRAETGIVGGTQVSPSILVTNGYSFNPHWDTGLTVGWERYGWSSYVPFLASGRFNLLNRYFTPYIDVIGGYVMPTSNWDRNKGGFTTGIRLGFTRYLNNRFGFSTSIGYRYVYLKAIDNWWDDFVTIRQLNRFELKFALTFK